MYVPVGCSQLDMKSNTWWGPNFFHAAEIKFHIRKEDGSFFVCFLRAKTLKVKPFSLPKPWDLRAILWINHELWLKSTWRVGSEWVKLQYLYYLTICNPPNHTHTHILNPAGQQSSGGKCHWRQISNCSSSMQFYNFTNSLFSVELLSFSLFWQFGTQTQI